MDEKRIRELAEDYGVTSEDEGTEFEQEPLYTPSDQVSDQVAQEYTVNPGWGEENIEEVNEIMGGEVKKDEPCSEEGGGCFIGTITDDDSLPIDLDDIPDAAPDETNIDLSDIPDTPLGTTPAKPLAKNPDADIKDALIGEDKESFLGMIQAEIREWGEVIAEGWDESITGMLYHGKAPKPSDKKRSYMQNVLKGTVSGTIDVPYYLAGLALGGGPTSPTGWGGAMALPAGVRKVLMDRYEKGEIKTPSEFALRASDAIKETVKAEIAGMAGHGAGQVAPQLLKVPAEAVAMTAVGGLLEGRIPSAQEFEEAVGVMLSIGIANRYIGKSAVATKNATAKFKKKLSDTYVETGKTPKELLAEIEKDPSILEDLVSENIDVPRAIRDKIVKAEPKGKGLKDKFVEDWIDKLDPIKNMMEEVMGGRKETMGLTVAESPYKRARLAKGVHGKIKHFFEHGAYDYNTLEPTSKPLRGILRDVGKKNLEEFTNYIVAKRAKELQARGKKTPFDGLDLDTIIANGEGKYAQSFKDLVQYENAALAHLRDSGVITKEAYDNMVARGESYIPFVEPPKGTKGFKLPSTFQPENPVREYKGHSGEIVDPLMMTVSKTALYLSMAEKNEVMSTFARFGKEWDPSGEFIRTRKDPRQKSGKDALEEMGLIEKDLEVAPEVAEAKGTKSDLYYFENGSRRKLSVAPELAETLRQLGKEEVNFWVKLAAKPASWLRAGATLNPEFASRNIIRDQLSSFIYTKHGVMPKFGLDFAKGMFSALRQDKMYQNWLKSGGAQASMVSVDMRGLEKTTYRELTSNKALNIVKNPIEGLRILSSLSESGTRLGEFKLASRKYGKKMPKKDAMLEAGYESREITLDFRKSGYKGQNWNMATAFFNACMQGHNKIWRQMRDYPVRTSMKAVAAITIPSVISSLMWHDHPQIEEIPRWQKDIFWLVPIATSDDPNEDIILRVPKPFEIGILFGTIPERITSHILTKDPSAWDDIWQTVEGQMPSLIPTGAVGILETMTGHSFFKQRPLVPLSAEKKLIEYRYNTYTSEVAKKVSQMVGKLPIVQNWDRGYSPIEIENLVNSYTGGLGRHLMNIVDWIGREAGALPDPPKPKMDLADMPVIKAFIARHPSTMAESVTKFREEWKKAKQNVATVNGLLTDEFNFSDASNIMEEGVFNVMDGYKKAIDTMYDLIVKIHYLPDSGSLPKKLLDKMPEGSEPDEAMTRDEFRAWKSQIIDSLYYQMIEVSKYGLEALETFNMERE